jgi:lysophospholipase L1-like esterase
MTYNLIGKIQALVPQYDLGYLDEGVGGDTIRSMKIRLPEILSIIINHKYFSTTPTLVILLWDSDICDFDERNVNPEDIPRQRQVYKDDIGYVLTRLLDTGASIALGGPMFCKVKESYKDQELVEYVAINHGVCDEYNIPYMDIRAAFIAYESDINGMGQRYATDDGEHPSNGGTQVLATMFAQQIASWQTNRTSVMS